ncbi:MAG: DUF4347 domain-containing protein, partial [Thiobacillus sp.]
MFSADFAPALADALVPQAEVRLIGSDGEFVQNTATDSPLQAEHARFEVVFIDLRVQGYQQILADIHEQNTSGRSIEVVLLDAERDGVAQIGDFLSQRQAVDAVHIISHGSPGTVQLGSGQLNFESLLQNAAAIEQWGYALSSEADILIYGCDLASTEEGQSLVVALSRLTGADVAASDDKTGSASLGGDWTLEVTTGPIEATLAPSTLLQADWQGLLALETPGLWLSARSSATTSPGTGGLTYNDGQITRFTDPNLALGSGTSGGTFSQVFDIDAFAADGNANVSGLHYVGRSVTVGTTNPVMLQAGDVLLSTAANETLGGVAVTTRDIVLFRPTTPGDYSAGSFSVLIRDPGNTGNSIREFALVETAMTVGGTALQAGDFLLSLTSGTYESDISLFRPTTMATSPTGGSLIVLIDGDGSAGIGFGAKISGIDLVQQPTILGNALLGIGTIVVALDANDTVGINNLSVTPYDAFALTVTATGSGTSSASASMLLRGADVGLAAGGEEIDAIAIVSGYTAGNAAPTLALPGGALAYVENAGAVIVDGAATLADADSADFAGGRLVADLATTGTAPDRLAIRHEGNAAGQIGVSGANVSYGGVLIGSFTGGAGSTPLVVSFNASATPAAVQALVRNLSFENTSEAPVPGERTLRVAVSDGDGGTSAIASKTITVTAVEDPGLWISVGNSATSDAESGALSFNDG